MNGQELPDETFVSDLATKFNRFGIIYHLPSMKLAYIHDYYKSINKQKWVLERNSVRHKYYTVRKIGSRLEKVTRNVILL